MNSDDQERLRELSSAFHKLGVAVSELSAHQEGNERRIKSLEDTLLHGSNALKSEVAVLRTRTHEQINLCKETRAKHEGERSSRTAGRATIMAALITGGLAFLASVVAIVVTIMQSKGG